MFHDSIFLDGVRRTADGYLVADAKVARTGIQVYRGYEVGKPELDTVRVYRPEAEVFSEDSVKSYAYRPVTIEHPREQVTADNWKKYAVGQTSGDIVRDGQFVRVPLVLMDSEAIKAVENGKREISMGYTAKLVFDSGTTPDGEEYDAIQTDLRMNHLAVVTRARGGSELKLGDSGKGGQSMPDALRKVVVDGLTIETTDQGAEAIQKLQKQLNDAAAAHQTEVKNLQTDLAKKDAQIDELKGKVLDDSALDALVVKRADLISKAKALAPNIQTDGKSDLEIKKAVVVAKVGDAAIAGKPDAYVEARFDILAETVKDSGDPVRDGLSNIATMGSAPHQSNVLNLADAQSRESEARAKYLERFNRKKA